MKTTYEVIIRAIIECDADEFSQGDIESSAVICFLKTDTITDAETFVPRDGSLEVVEYTETSVKEINP